MYFMALLLAMLAGCADGDLFNPTQRGSAQLKLRPVFSSLSASVNAAEINLVRLTITEQPSGQQLFQDDFPVDPLATEWALPIEVPPNIVITVLVELINNGPFGQVVEFSGILGPITVGSGDQPTPPSVTVFPGPPSNLGITSVTIAPRSQTILEGDALQLNAATAPTVGVVSWVSRNPAVAAVDANGRITSVGPGTTTIVAVAGPRADSTTVTVAARATRVAILPATVSLTSIGATATYTATAFDVRNAAVPGHTFTWSIDDPTIATMVSPGVFRALRTGSTTVRATTTSGTTTLSASAGLTVNQTVATVTVSPATHGFTAFGQTQQFTAQARDAGGNVMDLPATWNSTNPAVATVTASGFVTAVANGNTTIEATIAGVKGTAAVTVQQTAVNFAVTPEAVTINAAGGTALLTAAMRDAQGNPMPTPLVVWTTSNPAVATVTQSGLVTGHTNGTANITAVSGTFTDFAVVTVQRTARSIEIRTRADTITTGASSNFSAVAIDQGGTIIVGHPIQWSSSNPSVATVDPATGVVTGVAVGSATITASADGVSASHVVHVKAGGGFHVAGRKILLYHAESQIDAEALKARLVATGKFHPDSIHIAQMQATPLSLEHLSQYGAVFAWTDFSPADPLAIGNRLKEYVDAGGKVLLAVYALSPSNSPWNLEGGIMGPGYNPLYLPPNSNAFISGTRHLDFSTALTSHPILQGVESFTFCSNSNYPLLGVDEGATLVATDTQGAPLIGVSANGRVVAINVWPLFESHCATSSAPFIDRAFANALQ
jgi:uncharacterized protein YjdB